MDQTVADIKALHVVYATWCPHCSPTIVEPMKKVATELGVPCYLYDIDNPEEESKADQLVRRYGDWSEDYLVPQVFVEMNSGETRHVLTGNPQGVELTRRAVENLMTGSMFKKAATHPNE